MNIYLDIDGVLIQDSLDNYGVPASYAVDFLGEMTSKHTCYWLTTHCMNGENHAPEFLKARLPKEAHKYIDKVLPLSWNNNKTEAIDFTKDFRWFDDNVYPEETYDLEKNQCENKLVKINLRENPKQLLDIIRDEP